MKVSMSMTLDGIVRALRTKKRSLADKIEGRRGNATKREEKKGRAAIGERRHERSRA